MLQKGVLEIQYMLLKIKEYFNPKFALNALCIEEIGTLSIPFLF